MDFIIKRKVLIAMLFAGISMLGVFSYRQLPVELFPNTQIPYLFVTIGSALETDPEYTENQAVIPIEGAIATLKGVEKIESTIDQNQAFIQISYRQNTDLKIAYLKLLEKIEEVRQDLPSGFFVEALRFDMEMLNNNLMTLQVRGGGGVDRVREIVNRDIYNRLQNVNGIANVAVFGGRQKSVEIRLRDEVCRSYGISAATVRSALAGNNMPRTYSGKVIQDNRMVFVNVKAEYTEISHIRDIVVKEQGDIRLKDIADIKFGFKEVDSYSRVNGKEAVTIQLTRDTQSNMIDLSHRVQAEISALNAELTGKDVEIVIQNNSADRMEKNINQIINLAIVGGVLAMFILWIFLKNIRLVLSIGLAMPISVYTAFNFFYAAGITINSITLLGMALAIGMLLDNSVVVLENIYRLVSQSNKLENSIIQGTREVWRSIFAGTLTTVMVFLPFAFSKNFFVAVLGKHIGVSVISTLLISLLVAVILIPMLTHFSLKKSREHQSVFSSISFDNRLMQIYRVILKTCMRNPAKTAIGALIVFFATLLISLGLSFISVREPEIIELSLYVTLPGGTTLENTDLLVSEAETRLENLQEKKDIISQIYEEEAQITIVLDKNYKKIRNFSVPKIKQEIMNSLGGLEPATFSWELSASARRFGGQSNRGDEGMEEILGIGSETEKVLIKGEDYDQLVAQANLVKYYLSQQQSVEWSNVNIPSARPEVILNFDKQIMALYDIRAEAVVTELGSFPHEFTSGVKFKQGTEDYDIQIITEITEFPDEQTGRNLADLKKLPVKGVNNTSFDLEHISKFNFSEGVPVIKRVNQSKQLEVEYAFIRQVQDEKDLLEQSRLEIESLLGNMALPSGTTIEVFHETEDLIDFRFLILAALILIYMILASVFESFSKPIVILCAIPLAGIGSMIALILTGNSLLNANTLTGFVILIGIVVNNGIILIDYSGILIKKGFRPSRSLITAGMARVRPILITSITTIIALVPLAMGKAEYVAEVGAPFAITIIGGLGLSTLLTLVFIPTLNTGISASLNWIFSLSWKHKTAMALIMIVLGYLIADKVDSLVWKIIDYILLVILTPAAFYFVMNSLRQASEKVVDENEPLQIKVRNLVKIYDRESRFMREWKSGIKTRTRKGFEKNYTGIKDFQYILWVVPILAFFIYFIYFYLDKVFWYFMLPVFLYMILVSAIRPVRKFADGIRDSHKWKYRILVVLMGIVYWTMPLVFLILFYLKYKLIGLIIPFAVIWYFILAIIAASDRIYREKINITRLSGRFKGMRKAFYRIVLAIPVIGKKKVPFKALKGVSFNIEHGMFGLLGPNGAGKSTLMRIICGILEPSYGQITINGIDTRLKREELQGLIGYLPQEFGIYENLTAWEFLNYMGILKKIYDRDRREERIEYVLNAVHMTSHKHEKLGSFSGGMKQRIGIAQILMHLPRILVVDEPTAGLDPRERIRFRNLLVELSRDRIVIFSTHIIEDVASSCNQVAVVRSGELVYLGAPVDMAQIASGKVWTVDMNIDEFESFRNKYQIIHHMRDADKIRVRFLADERPVEKAHNVKANLEDAYLCLLQNEMQTEPLLIQSENEIK